MTAGVEPQVLGCTTAVHMELRSESSGSTLESSAKISATLPHGSGRAVEELLRNYPMMCFCDAASGSPNAPCKYSGDGHKGRVPWPRKILWGAPLFGWYALKFLKIGYMKKFYMDDYPRASLGILAFGSVISTIIDACTDPLMSTWTDNLRSKYGRRRPFVLASAIFVPVVYFLAWTPLVPSGVQASVWFSVFHVGVALAQTLFLMPHAAWGAQLTPVYKDKTSAWFWGDLCTNFGILVGMAVLPLMFVTDGCLSTPDNGCTQLPTITFGLGVFFSLLCLNLFWNGKEAAPSRLSERISVSSSKDPEKGVAKEARFSELDLLPRLLTTFLNKPFRILMVSGIVKAIGQDIPFAVLPFMVAWGLGEKCFSAGKMFGYLVIANLVFGIFASMVWAQIAHRTSKYLAFVLFISSVAASSAAFFAVDFDSGDCVYSYVALVISCFFGAAYGGAFLINTLVADVIDYDEFLTGGLRREASYLMALHFVPKFMNIPGESIPFLALAYLGYVRPLPTTMRFPCSSPHDDDLCTSLYANETEGAGWCSQSATCADLSASGVSFVCNVALEECGIRQTRAVQETLSLCFSLVPCVCLLGGLLALLYFPKHARTKEAHDKLLQAIAIQRSGQAVEDPWRPGSWVPAVRRVPQDVGALAYFLPSELGALLKGPSDGEAQVDFTELQHSCVKAVALSVALMPVGLWIIIAGIEDLATDLGASVSPLGMMVLGIGFVGTWFGSMRLSAAYALPKLSLTRNHVIARYNALCPFTGKPQITEAPQRMDSE